MWQQSFAQHLESSITNSRIPNWHPAQIGLLRRKLMSRFHHGSLLVEEDAPAQPAVINPTANVSAAAQPAIAQTRFGFLFPQLQHDEYLLTKSEETVNNLIAL